MIDNDEPFEEKGGVLRRGSVPWGPLKMTLLK